MNTETDNVKDMQLPRELDRLAEAMAENVHDTWMQGRLEQGWKFGNERNDERKEHPCLVPYGQLPESEKEFDRKTAEATLKFILKAGFRISPAGNTERDI